MESRETAVEAYPIFGCLVGEFLVKIMSGF